MSAFTVLRATVNDVKTLSETHVQTFRESHGGGPSVDVRMGQWHSRLTEGMGFVFLAEHQDRAIGFASGFPYQLDDLPFDGRLEKIYVLKAWHRQGVGRLLFEHVVQAFLDAGITSMLTFSQADNPSIGFFERLGGHQLFGTDGRFDGGYGWGDIRLPSDRAR